VEQKSKYTDKLKDENLSLEDKLELIDKMMNDKDYLDSVNKSMGRPIGTPVDPQDALNCEGCQ
jgi:hypothetical protein